LLARIAAAGVAHRTCTRIKRTGSAQKTSYLTAADLDALAFDRPADPNWLRVREAARLTGVRTADISRAADNGEIDAAGRRRQRRIKLESLNAWMARRAAKVERRRRKATARASSTPTVPAAAA